MLATAPTSDLERAVAQLRETGYLIELAHIGTGADFQPADDSFEALFASKILLVRPDGHIAACFTPALAARQLGEVVSDLFPRG